VHQITPISQGSVRRVLQARGHACAPQTPKRQYRPDATDAVITIVYQSPRLYGLPYSRWTLSDLATVLAREGYVRRISPHTLRKRLRARNVAYRWRKGSPSRRFGAATVEAIIALLHEDPRAHGFAQGIWSLAHLAVALARAGHVTMISPRTIRRLLRTRGVSWEQARQWVHRPHPRFVRPASERPRLYAVS
jgi:hypothetical protein